MIVAAVHLAGPDRPGRRAKPTWRRRRRSPSASARSWICPRRRGWKGRRGGPAAGRRLRFPWALVAERGRVRQGQTRAELCAKMRRMGRMVALLRAVNVGGRKLPMAELRALCAELGWRTSRPISRAATSSSRADGKPRGARGGARRGDQRSIRLRRRRSSSAPATQWAGYAARQSLSRGGAGRAQPAACCSSPSGRPHRTPPRRHPGPRRRPARRSRRRATRSGSISRRAPAPRS